MESDPSRPVVSATALRPMNARGPSRQARLGVERLTLIALAVVGAITAVVGARLAPDRLWASWLLVSYYIARRGLAGLCFVAIHYTTGASWSVAVRRVAEALAGTLLLGIVLLAVVFDRAAATVSMDGRGQPRFGCGHRARVQAVLAFPAIFSRTGRGVRGHLDRCSPSRFDGARGSRTLMAIHDGLARTSACLRRSSLSLAVTFTLASVDWVMSLEPLWYSTIFGIYNFAGLFQSGLAALILVALWLERRGPLRDVLNDEHLHDLGKLLFAFSVFWVYIWFSQYMLIWYTNIPEETTYFHSALARRLARVVSRQPRLQLDRAVRGAAAARHEAPPDDDGARGGGGACWAAGSTSI